MFRVEMLPARQGDCLMIEYGSDSDRHRVLVDGGPPPTWDVLSERVGPGDRLDLAVGSHVDIDHLYGMLRLLTYADDVHVEDVWFNGWKHLPRPLDILGAVEGEMLSAVIERRGLPWNAAFTGGAVVVGEEDDLPRVTLDGGMELTLLLPTAGALADLRPVWEATVKEHALEPGDADAALERWRKKEKLPADALGDERPNPDALAQRRFTEDDSKPNGSSIAFVAEYEDKRCLFAGDSHPSHLAQAVERLARKEGTARLRLDATKLSHHGSAGSTNNELLDLLDCPRYLVSTSGASYGHPKPEAISRVLLHGGHEVELSFNYRTTFNDVWDNRALKAKYGYTTVYPEPPGDGLVVEL